MISYLGFVARLGVRLTHAQSILARVAFDGVQPCDLSGKDREVSDQLFGPIETCDDATRKVVSLVKGARVGGTWMCALRGLHLALNLDLSHLAAGERAFVGITAPSKSLARQALRYARGAIKKSRQLKRLLIEDGVDAFTIKRPDGAIVEFKILTASARGQEQRGAWLVFFHLVEASFMRDPDSGAVNDKDAYKAARPRIVKGGQLVLESTPWLPESLHWQLFEANYGNPSTALAVEAPTLLMRGDDPEIRTLVEKETERDETEADCEFRCKCQPSGSTHWFDADTVNACVFDGLTLPADKVLGEHFACADFGFRRDASTLAIVHVLGRTVTLVDLVELRPKRGQPLKPSMVVQEFADACKRYGVKYISADGHYREAITEYLEANELHFKALPEGQPGKIAQYTSARNAMREDRLRLPKHDRLTRQLRETLYRPVQGGGLQISNPRTGFGSHGDLVSSLVGAVYEGAKDSLPSNFRPKQPSKHSSIFGSVMGW